MIRKLIIIITLGAPIFSLGQTSDCQTQRLKERTWCTDRYYSKVTGPTEAKRVLDENLDLELDKRESACYSQFDLSDCERNMKLDQVNADNLYFSNMDKANKIWMASMTACAVTAMVPIPVAAQGAAGGCAVVATSALAIAYITIDSDYRLAVSTAKNKETFCTESLTSKLTNCKSTASKDIKYRKLIAQRDLDKIVIPASLEEQVCNADAEDRYTQCLNNRR
jgi:hypothetical protein